jgi:hypothetical protein
MMNKVIDGVGEDAEVVTNANGGKQSKSPMALHLVDPKFLFAYLQGQFGYSLFTDELTEFLLDGDREHLISAISDLAETNDMDALVEIGKVLQYGADKYEANNWRLIPQEEHINHALIHYYAAQVGDTQDEHLQHCLCRLMMAYATEKSENFDYSKYIKG